MDIDGFHMLDNYTGPIQVFELCSTLFVKDTRSIIGNTDLTNPGNQACPDLLDTRLHTPRPGTVQLLYHPDYNLPGSHRTYLQFLRLLTGPLLGGHGAGDGPALQIFQTHHRL